MDKKLVALGIGIIFIGVSCGYLAKNNDVADAQTIVSPQAHHEEVNTAPTANAEVVPEPRLESKPVEPVRHYDSKKLDDEVREEAIKMGKDPATYRRLVRQEPDGTKIYRQIGMHVIVSPNSEPVYLPDEL